MTRTEWDLDPGPPRLRIRVNEWTGSDGGRPPVVILHGFLEQGAAWDAVATRLDRRVIAPDHRGHGRSAHVGAGGFYHFWDYVGDLDGLIEHVGGPVDLVGHSMGGTIAALYAGSRPDRVRRLALIEGLGPPDAESGAIDRARAFLADLRDPPAHPPAVTEVDAADRLRRWNPALSADTASWLAARLLGGGTWGWDSRHRMRAPVPFQASIFCRFLREITAPTLIVEGVASPFRVPDAEARKAALVQASAVCIPGGHLLHHDNPGGLANAITSFLEDS